MAKSWIITALLLLSLTAVARTQYFDILEGLQQLFKPYQTKLIQNRINETQQSADRQTSKQEQRKRKPAPNQFDFIFGTTTKPGRKATKPSKISISKSSDKNYNNLNAEFMLSNVETTTKSNNEKSTTTPTTTVTITTKSNKENTARTPVSNDRDVYTTSTTENTLKINKPASVRYNLKPDSETIENKKSDKHTSTTTNINDYSRTLTDNEKRNVNVDGLTNRRSELSSSANIDARNIKTNFNSPIKSNLGSGIQNPLLYGPGDGPDEDSNSRAITNRQVNDNIYFPNSESFGEPQAPELLIGPNEDEMTSLQRRRYVDLAERMCDRYKAFNIRKLVALPPSLVPSPSPVEFNVSSCNPYSVPLIIGGKVVDIKEFPHMALVGWKKIGVPGYSWKCGGSLVSEQYILTAGHCTYQDKDYSAESGLPHAIQLGSSYLDDPGAQVVKTASIIRHPKYKRTRAYHDVALIKMVKKVSFSDVIKPACIGVSPPDGENIVATGWGRTEFGGDHSKELRSVSLPVWNIGECRVIWDTSLRLPNGPTPESHVCAGDRRGEKDTCQGDSGGPAQIQDGCVWRVVAVTSIGKSCAAPQTPALYAVIPRAFLAAQVFGEDVDYGGRGIVNRRGEEYYRQR